MPQDDFVRTFDQLCVLVVLNLLIWAGLDTLHAETGARFMLDGTYGWACYLLLGLFACAAVARIQDRAADTRGLLVPALSVAPYALTAFWLAGDTAIVAARPVTTLLVSVVYLLALGMRILRAAYGSVRPRTAVVAIGLIIVTPWILATLNLDTRLWVTDDTEQAQDSDDAAEAEPLLYDQPARLDAAVERIAPNESGEPAVFYVGFAGDGDQAVFKREALFAESVFADHFGSGERSLELVNDVDDRDTYPLATVSGLADALKLLASRMDTDQDVLVLTLTSHGSKDGIEVSNGSLPLLQLAPADLRQALDESGIKWRVLIVSACYSGVFLEPLKTDGTFIATASDADHSSFGCEDDRDLTYFGEAFLKESVPTTATLEAAFKKTADLIHKRETAEHLEHSNPQLYVGPAIREKLARLESRQAPKSQNAVIVWR
ncbi:MAG TPA: C13 family peptidase [Steroidobacteraceae bacterium]|nr:C13 family peptidase [Steroidobacteraceae bacterium]